MKVDLILPIAELHGKLNGKAPYYFKTVNGKTFVQRCPVRTAKPTVRQILSRSRFGKIARTVAQMQLEGASLPKKQLWQLASEAYESHA
jgi:hypothetical protein